MPGPRIPAATCFLGLLSLLLAPAPLRAADDPGIREITAEKKLLHFPVKSGAPKRHVEVIVDGRAERMFDVEFADGEPEWWAPLDISAWKGRKLVVKAHGLPADSKVLDSLQQADEMLGAENLYREPNRAQLHFSARRGWLNDPNGLVYHNGEYLMFFQHDPFGWHGGAKHWGLAVGRDLVHWEEVDEALYPDPLGAMWSGSAVVDWKNTSGFGKGGQPPLVLAYTAAGRRFTQCIAYSTDGRTFPKYGGNPVVEQITHGNRDPNVIWHEPSQQWVMTLYVELEGKHTIHFLTSPNLQQWTLASVLPGGQGDDRFLFECPDFFELPVDGDANNKKWVLTAADSDYILGSFDGKTFTPDSPKQKGHRGLGFYAAQTFEDMPAADGRRIQIGWLHTATPGPFNQAMSLPLELSLRTTPDGIRMVWQPARELEKLRTHSHDHEGLTLRPGHTLTERGGELVELRADFTPGEASQVRFTIRGIPVIYDVKAQEIIVNGHRASAPLQDGKQRLIVYADRTCLEVFASDGLTYVPMPVPVDSQNTKLEIAAEGGTAKLERLEIHDLASIWPDKQAEQKP